MNILDDMGWVNYQDFFTFKTVTLNCLPPVNYKCLKDYTGACAITVYGLIEQVWTILFEPFQIKNLSSLFGFYNL